ncbi:MAG: TonB family protein [Cyclobacteriaceae bacterium]|nr:TonB family protein [Cyclobacteriaceae bacterium]
MNTWLNYIVEANIGLLLFLLLYKILLSKETQFSYRRFYLLGGVILSLVFPWLTVSSPVEVIPTLSETLPAYWLPQSAEQVQQYSSVPTLTFWEIVVRLYIFVVTLLLIRFAYYVVSLVREARKSRNNNRVIEVEQPSFVAFSFFNLIFISKAFTLNESDKQRILQHERVHINNWHSLDIVLIELVRILFWFNPLLRYYKKEMSMVHEFEADEVASSGSEQQEQYCNLLARSALESSSYALANHFNNSLTLKRITMIRTLKRKVKQWKTLIVFLFVSVVFLGIACQDQIVEQMEELSQTTTIAGDFPDHLLPVVEKIRNENPGIKLIYVEAESANSEKIKNISTEDILFTHYDKYHDKDGNLTSERVGFIIRSDGAISQLAEVTKSQDDVFLVVEESASPIGGMTALNEAIQNQLVFPGEAKAKGIAGKVFIEFIIEPDGSTSNHRVIKGIGSGCDEEALRAMLATNIRWNPGKQKNVPVRQKYVVPIWFGEAPVTQDANGIYLQTEESAGPVGGMEALYNEINTNIKMPAEARRSSVSGKVYIEMIIEPDGSTSNHQIIKGIGYGCDEEALRVLSQASTKWHPAKQGGKVVRQKFVLPVTFANN